MYATVRRSRLFSSCASAVGSSKKSRANEWAAVARIVGRAQAARSLSATLKVVGVDLLNLFHASGILVAMENRVSARQFVWKAMRDSTTGRIVLQHRELASSDSGASVFDLPVEPCALERDGRSRWTPRALPQSFVNEYLVEAVLSGLVTSGVWSVRVCVLDPERHKRGIYTVRLLQRVISAIAPAVHSIYISRKAWTRVKTMERARLARELHDSVIQALIGLRMEVEVLRTTQNIGFSKVAAELARIEQRLGEQVDDIRQLMQQLKPLDVPARKLPDRLASVVGRFERETGIRTRLFFGLRQVVLPTTVCGELVRIAQEALFNVRKHARARNVVVEVAEHKGSYCFEIYDDGTGFDFSGSLSHDELDSQQRGPAVIKERVRGIGGHLSIESKPGHGSRISIRLPIGSRPLLNTLAASSNPHRAAASGRTRNSGH
jgi:signal transduction histidine kinase